MEYSAMEQEKDIVEGKVVEIKDAIEGDFVLEVDKSKGSLPLSVEDYRTRVKFNQESVKLMQSDVKTIQNL